MRSAETISMREALAQESYRKDPKQQRRLIIGKRMEGLDEILTDEGIDENIRVMFTPVDIYDGDIELMLNHFTSPLSPVLATTFYKFYITDTTIVDGQKCVELSFVPANQQSYGFTGRMYVSLDKDSTFALTKYVMTVSPHVNLNFVRDLSVVQTFRCDTMASGRIRWIPYRCDTYGRMYISKRIQELYVHQMRVYTNYDLSDTARLLPDSLFSSFEREVTLPRKDLLRFRSDFNERRPLKLSAKETVLDSMWIELARLPEFRALKYTSELLASGYIPTSAKRADSKFDIGPVFNILSFNHQEGWRVRLGGMSKAPLSPRNFVEGYAAYGFRDHRPKGNLTLTHTFDDKERHSHEAPFSSISLNGYYELETPGQSYDNFDRDNIMSSSDKEMKRLAETCRFLHRGGVPLRPQFHTQFLSRNPSPRDSVESASRRPLHQPRPHRGSRRRRPLGAAHRLLRREAHLALLLRPHRHQGGGRRHLDACSLHSSLHPLRQLQHLALVQCFQYHETHGVHHGLLRGPLRYLPPQGLDPQPHSSRQPPPPARGGGFQYPLWHPHRPEQCGPQPHRALCYACRHRAFRSDALHGIQSWYREYPSHHPHRFRPASDLRGRLGQEGLLVRPRRPQVLPLRVRLRE